MWLSMNQIWANIVKFYNTHAMDVQKGYPAFLLKLPSLLIFSKKNIYGKWFVNLGRNRVVCILQALHIFKDG